MPFDVSKFALIVKNKENVTFDEKIKKHVGDVNIYNLDELKDIDFSKYDFFFYFPDSYIKFSSPRELDFSKIDKYQLFYNGIFYYKINNEALELCYILFGDDFLNYFDFNQIEQDFSKIINIDAHEKPFVTIKTKNQVLENFNFFKKIFQYIEKYHFLFPEYKNFAEKHVYFSFIDCIDEPTLKDYAISLLKDYINFSDYGNETNIYSLSSMFHKDTENRFYNIYKYYITPVKG